MKLRNARQPPIADQDAPEEEEKQDAPAAGHGQPRAVVVDNVDVEENKEEQKHIPFNLDTSIDD